MTPSSPLSSKAASAASAGRPDDVANASHSSATPKPANTNLLPPNKTKGQNLAYRTALSRSYTPQQPVLVHPGPSPSASTASSAMRKKTTKPTNSASDHTTPPPDPAAFTFPSLLASLGPDADETITAIAEICGKSNLSLAEEHTSHLPPHGAVSELNITRLENPASGEGRMEGEGEGAQTRSMTKRRGERSGAVAATTAINARAQQTRREGDENFGVLPQILAWLRGAGSKAEEDGVTSNLHGLLDEGGVRS
ncbi:MAG: hypothetical protein Q9164_004005 [Protoblastenia rupestris]